MRLLVMLRLLLLIRISVPYLNAEVNTGEYLNKTVCLLVGTVSGQNLVQYPLPRQSLGNHLLTSGATIIASSETYHEQAQLTGQLSPGTEKTTKPETTEIDTEFRKEFFSYTAPEDQADDDDAIRQAIGHALKRNLRVLFIRTPENKGLENAALALANQAAEQKTAIYVLTKQTDIAELAKKLNSMQRTEKQKPEVHFVKYRTAEDAIRAQQAIQAHYSQVPGETIANTAARANVLNFVPQMSQTSLLQQPNAQYVQANTVAQGNYAYSFIPTPSLPYNR